MESHSWPVILTYHSISSGRSPLCTSPRLFAQQMAWLRASGHRVVPLAGLIEALEGKRELPRRAVALTFDDGFSDFHDAAFPILRRLEFPATVFLVTAYSGATNRWPGQPAWAEERSLLSWEQVRDLAQQGVSFGAHSDTHPDLSRLSREDLDREVALSRNKLLAQLGAPPEFFCYPYGRCSSRARAVVSRSFRGACGTEMRRVRPESDLFYLPRVDAFYLRSAPIFRQLFTRRGHFYLNLRNALRQLRARYDALRSGRRREE